jgi:predicted GH43/DUF377 family glycosyl hydrolase
MMKRNSGWMGKRRGQRMGWKLRCAMNLGLAGLALAAGAVQAAAAPAGSSTASQASVNRPEQDGVFEWQFPNKNRKWAWERYSFSEKHWWGGFPKDVPAPKDLFGENPWALGPFTKHPANPILAPTPGAWDQGRLDGGVHNGAILVKDGVFYYVYRGERPIDIKKKSGMNYMCDIGVATSTDGVHFVKDTLHSPFFRKGEGRRYSFEDVNIARHGDTYYLFCNQWDWECSRDLSCNGTFLATSKDLLNWQKRGIVFPNAKRMHRNGVVLQNPENEAVKINGKFVMYLNSGLMAYSEDMIHWESKGAAHSWHGGEGCFALTDHDPARPEDIILFTGGHHTGHFYAAGQVRFSKQNPEKPLATLPRPFLVADPSLYWENGFGDKERKTLVSSYADCIFFNGLTRYQGKWWLYYGGSEYYTCLATAEAR